MKFIFYFIFLIIFQIAQAKTNLSFQLKPNPPDEGENRLEVSISDEKGPIEKAKIEVKFSMPEMGTMPSMQSTGKITELGKGKYQVDYNLDMGGSWEMSLNFKEGDKTKSFLYNITTGVPGLNNKNEEDVAATNEQDTPKLKIGTDRLQKIGVRFAEAKKIPLKTVLNAVGVVEEDNTNRAEVNVRFSGYLEKQFIGRVGDAVSKEEPLATIYSPELIAAENEYIFAQENFTKEMSIKKLTEEKLKTLGINEKDLREIKKNKSARKTLTLRSPISGTILAINAREGSSIKSGDVLYTIGNLSKNYIVARIFQQDIIEISKNQSVDITFNNDKSKILKGKVDLIYPNIAEGSGTLNVRVQPIEMDEQLKPGTYVDLLFKIDFGEKLCVPIEAILYSGKHNYVFVDKGNGVLDPREVTTGNKSETEIEIKSGVQENEKVVASGQFLISAEAQLRSALPKWKQN